MKSRKFWVHFGILLFSMGVILNEKTITAIFSPDKELQSFSLRIRIVAFQILLLGLGYVCIKFRYTILSKQKRILPIMSGILLIALGILVNEWFVAKLFGLYGTFARLGIWIVNIEMIVAGGILLCKTDYPTKRKDNVRLIDTFVCIFFIAFSFLFISKFVNFSALPNEDAAMLMRYSDHLAKGNGIVWNIGEKPVDGATDFLFMILVAWLSKIHFSIEFSTRLLGFFAHILTIELIYLMLRKFSQCHIIPAFLATLYLAIGPGFYYVAAYFGTPFFALFGTITWCLALVIIEKTSSYGVFALFALSSVITGMIRPEGVILALLMLLAIVYVKGMHQISYYLLCFFLIFGVVGGIYFFWRWNYFGYPLPNPFYIKGGGHIYIASLIESFAIVGWLCLPFWPAFILGLCSPEKLNRTCYSLIPIIGFSASFLFLSLETNFGYRFQYVVLPIVLVSWGTLIQRIEYDFHLFSLTHFAARQRFIMSILLGSLGIGILFYQHQRTQYIANTLLFRDGRYDVACLFNEYRDKDFILATTEAGLLPFYSHWYTIDTYGLNDQWIAHHGLQEQYLNRYRPHIIMFHEFFSLFFSSNPNIQGGWYEMVIFLKNYAEKNNYVLAAIFGDGPHDTHYYYVRSDFPESQELVDKIRKINYYYFLTNRQSVNYVNILH